MSLIVCRNEIVIGHVFQDRYPAGRRLSETEGRIGCHLICSIVGQTGPAPMHTVRIYGLVITVNGI
jgi:hypothetical protein